MKKILIPCDFSENSDTSLLYGTQLAKDIGADLVLVHINHFPVVAPEIGLSAYTYQDSEKDSIEALQKIKLKIIGQDGFRGQIDCLSSTGDIAEGIESFAKENMADLVIMGIRTQQSKLIKNMIGSSAVSVGKDTEVPVLIVPDGTVYKKPDLFVYSCHYDPEILIEPGFLKVKNLAEALGGRLELLHVIEESKENEYPLNTNFSEFHPLTGDIKTFIIHEKHAAEGILNFLKEHPADVIAVQPKKHSLFDRIFKKSVTTELAFSSPVPVLTVH